MVRLDELLVFTTILDAGSLAEAARRLRRSSPAVTRSLAALEDRIGVRLVQRTTRKLAPTEAGRQLATSARKLLAEYSEATGDVSANLDAPLQGLLRVTAPSLFGRWHVTPLVTSFLQAHPGIRIELVLTNSTLDLIEEGFDVAVRIGQLADSRLVARRVADVREVLIAKRRLCPLLQRNHNASVVGQRCAGFALGAAGRINQFPRNPWRASSPLYAG